MSMNTTETKRRWSLPRARAADGPVVLRLQLLVLAGFTLFAISVIAWISRLIYVSWAWQDVFSASIGIALVAVPVFMVLLTIVNYTFWGLVFGKEAESADGMRNLER